jgi:hypothetical protein
MDVEAPEVGAKFAEPVNSLVNEVLLTEDD